MSFAWLPCLVLCVNAAQGDALEISNPRLTYGYLGAARPMTGILPGDIVHVTFEIKNLKFDENGKAAYSIAIEIRDEKGKLFFEQRPYNSLAQNFLGGNSLPCAANVEIPYDAKPGKVDWKITVVDRTTKKSASLSGAGKILPADFGIVRVGLFADPELRVPTSPVGVVGDAAYLQMSVVGFERDKDKKQPDLHVSMRILDEKGQPTLAKPIVGKFNSGVNPKDHLLPLQFPLSMNRAGRFTIELTAECKLCGKRAQVSYAIRVLPLE
jgi:hypothetical protein